jgi:hypothetical protein
MRLQLLLDDSLMIQYKPDHSAEAPSDAVRRSEVNTIVSLGILLSRQKTQKFNSDSLKAGRIYVANQKSPRNGSELSFILSSDPSSPFKENKLKKEF